MRTNNGRAVSSTYSSPQFVQEMRWYRTNDSELTDVSNCSVTPPNDSAHFIGDVRKAERRPDFITIRNYDDDKVQFQLRPLQDKL
ncbi:hypothetical protein RB195_019901 [Necator americanus]|uniref:Uncharacterized protein n=1 Tax=Necator americanus TaxID=51031 RepID=A0ABR1CHV4_NECAM